MEVGSCEQTFKSQWKLYCVNKPLNFKVNSDRAKEKAKKIKEKSAIIKGHFRFRLVWIGPYA